MKTFLLLSVQNKDKLYDHIQCLGQYQIVPCWYSIKLHYSYHNPDFPVTNYEIYNDLPNDPKSADLVPHHSVRHAVKCGR